MQLRPFRALVLLFCLGVLSFVSSFAHAGSGFGSEFEGDEEAPHYVSPFTGIKKVAIVPFFALTDAIDPIQFSKAFAGQMENYPGWEVIYPQVVDQMATSQQQQIRTSHDAISIARQLGCDGVILGEIRDFSPYYPPKIVLKVALYRTDLRADNNDIMNMMRRGIAKDTFSGYTRGEPIYTLSENYDAGREKVTNLIRRYAAEFDQTRDPLKYDLYLRVKDRFFEAISYTIRQDMYMAQEVAAALQEEGVDSKKYLDLTNRAEEYRAVHKDMNPSGSRSRRERNRD